LPDAPGPVVLAQGEHADDGEDDEAAAAPEPGRQGLKPITNTIGLQSILKGRPGSTITNGRESRSCLVRVFNSKLGCIATLGSKCMVSMQPLLKLKTRPRAHHVS
jgi:hypothetical protein